MVAEKYSYRISGNEIEIELDNGFKDNSIYEIKLNNIKSKSGDLISKTITFTTKIRPLYSDIFAVKSLLGDIDIEDNVILYHIKEASKFVNYIISNSDYPFKVDEDNVPFNVSQFVKYYAAHECLLRHTVDMSSSTGISGKVGEVSFSEKETVKDISNLLKHFCSEIDKWKEDIRGYGFEGRARMTSAVRGINADPYRTSLRLNRHTSFGRGELYE